MDKSKLIASIVGPTLVVMVLSEMKLWNPTLYYTQIVPLIYLNGVLLFIAGLAILRNHNIWIYNWQMLITIIGYLLIFLGVFRMFFPQLQKSEFDNSNFILFFQIILVFVGIFLTYKSFYPERK